MSIDLNKFASVARRLNHENLFGSGPPKPPYGKKPTVQRVLNAVNRGEPALPLLYRTSYAEPLKAQLPSALINPDPQNRLEGDILETVTGAVYQHAANMPVANELNRFLAVISNLYRSFLDDVKRANLSLPSVETVPPLAVFQSNGRNGPFTIPVNGMQGAFGIDVGVVSLPSAMRRHPIVWAALAHEVGGHDVLHADDGLLDELAEAVRQHFGGGPLGTGTSLTPEQLLSELWAWWIDEAASDIYGLLNIGPTFALNLAFFFASFRAPPGSLGPNDPPLLSSESGFDPNDPAQELDPHPTDILRLSLAIGAIQSLPGLSTAARNAYIADLRNVISLCAGGNDTITLVGNVFPNRTLRLPLQLEVPLAPMQAAAEQVGQLIVSAQLQTLDGHAIQEIETWDDPDEAAAQHVAQLISAGQSAVGAGDDAQLLAGATLAVLVAPQDYDDITGLLNEALDDSYARDPIWHPLQPDPFAIRFVTWGEKLAAPPGTITRLSKRLSKPAAWKPPRRKRGLTVPKLPAPAL